MKIKGWNQEDLQDAFQKDEENPCLELGYECIIDAIAGQHYKINTSQGNIHFGVPSDGRYHIKGIGFYYTITRI